MKKIVIFIITILVLGVLAMTSCIQNSKRIEQEKEKVATISNEIIDNNTEMSNTIQDDNIENQEQQKVENIVEEDENIKQETKTELADSKTINNNQSTIKDTKTKISTDKQIVVNNSQQTNIASETKKEEQSEKQQETITQTTQTESKNTENTSRIENRMLLLERGIAKIKLIDLIILIAGKKGIKTLSKSGSETRKVNESEEIKLRNLLRKLYSENKLSQN